jgi:hypothetical protein
MTKGRSPNYPSMPLADALERLKKVYEGLHTYAAPRAVILENLGYSGPSGRALTVLATLRRYGLLVPEGKGQVKVSDRAVAILVLPEHDPERNEAIRQAAFEPALFSELHNDFPGPLPSDSALKHYLIKKGFMPKAAEEIIHVYKANLELVEEQGSEYNAPMPTEISPQHSVARAELNRIFASKTASDLAALGVPIPRDGKELRFNISRGSEAQVIFTGPVTQEAIDKLARLLELQKDTFPTEAELQQQPENDS